MLDFNLDGSVALAVDVSFKWKKLFRSHFRGRKNILDPYILVCARLRWNGVNMNMLRFETRQHVHHVTGIFIPVTDEYQPLQMVGRKAANGIVDRIFDVCAALID